MSSTKPTTLWPLSLSCHFSPGIFMTSRCSSQRFNILSQYPWSPGIKVSQYSPVTLSTSMLSMTHLLRGWSPSSWWPLTQFCHSDHWLLELRWYRHIVSWSYNQSEASTGASWCHLLQWVCHHCQFSSTPYVIAKKFFHSIEYSCEGRRWWGHRYLPAVSSKFHISLQINCLSATERSLFATAHRYFQHLVKDPNWFFEGVPLQYPMKSSTKKLSSSDHKCNRDIVLFIMIFFSGRKDYESFTHELVKESPITSKSCQKMSPSHPDSSMWCSTKLQMSLVVGVFYIPFIH